MATEHTALVINDERQASPSNVKQGFFYANVATTAGAVLTIVPALYGAAVNGNNVMSSVSTAVFAGAALTLAAVNYMRSDRNNSATTTLLVGLQACTTIFAEVSSIVNITNNPNLASALSVAGGAAMNASGAVTATLSSFKK